MSKTEQIYYFLAGSACEVYTQTFIQVKRCILNLIVKTLNVKKLTVVVKFKNFQQLLTQCICINFLI